MENSETVLVTGGTGAVGVYCILADLTRDGNWDKAMRGCKFVLHIASPTHSDSPKDENEMIRPAVDGVLRVLKAAKNSGVKRVVMTSSFGALGFSNKDPNTETTEADWTDPNEKGLSPYEKSKGLAERAAWNFISAEGGNLELAVINPVAIFGPLLGPGKSPSLGILKFLLDGSMKATPNIPLNVVDIRDVADLHIRAMTNPGAGGQRFIASADGEISIPEIALLIKTRMPGVAKKVPAKTLPDWVLTIAALFNPQAKQAALLLKINRKVSNAKAKKVLGWTPVANNEEAILASMESMIKFGIMKYEELLIILLQNQPELAGIFFDYGAPEKINLEEFMNRNFKFNVHIGRFAYLTRRSLSAFKRDFKTVFNETPNRWLVQKRLQEAHFLIEKKNKKASEIYLDLGFEDLSHFSFAFRRLFGLRPTELAEQKKRSRD